MRGASRAVGMPEVEGPCGERRGPRGSLASLRRLAPPFRRPHPHLRGGARDGESPSRTSGRSRAPTPSARRAGGDEKLEVDPRGDELYGRLCLAMTLQWNSARAGGRLARRRCSPSPASAPEGRGGWTTAPRACSRRARASQRARPSRGLATKDLSPRNLARFHTAPRAGAARGRLGGRLPPRQGLAASVSAEVGGQTLSALGAGARL